MRTSAWAWASLGLAPGGAKGGLGGEWEGGEGREGEGGDSGERVLHGVSWRLGAAAASGVLVAANDGWTQGGERRSLAGISKKSRFFLSASLRVRMTGLEREPMARRFAPSVKAKSRFLGFARNDSKKSKSEKQVARLRSE